MGVGFAPGMSSSLPPSGPMAASNNDWYGQQGGVMPDNYEASQDQQQPYEENQGPVVETADASNGSDPLSELEPLRQALPETGTDN